MTRIDDNKVLTKGWMQKGTFIVCNSPLRLDNVSYGNMTTSGFTEDKPKALLREFSPCGLFSADKLLVNLCNLLNVLPSLFIRKNKLHVSASNRYKSVRKIII